MTGPDLAALRKAMESRLDVGADSVILDALDVLALVDDLRAENERLREAINAALSNESRWWQKAQEALAGSPAANEEATDA